MIGTFTAGSLRESPRKNSAGVRNNSYPLPDYYDRVADDNYRFADSLRKKSCQLFWDKNRANFCFT
jgi:hypothetical protein